MKRELKSLVKNTARVAVGFWLLGTFPLGRRIKQAVLNNTGIGG